jgi:hypothetical protein
VKEVLYEYQHISQKKARKKVEKEDKKNINAVYHLLDKAYYVEAINFKIDNTLDNDD